ncbi:hypothetical protein [Clostridium weizhouense]|uniref:Uncharacterized protein n=1 Tax=Clostridium weizhouense TaxID=2859781 RepID=A0ABS7ANQ3_9CLOT|nr:hypothetical protein [Clostridium weizhouense]MBW6410264.1 hypothetical protein [Clostridium weizhouense]
MKNIIYSKYSNERSDQFKIRTDILKDSTGTKFVQKRALTDEAQKHINNIYVYYNLLFNQYKGSDISINKCSKLENCLEFEYIYGKTLAEELDELLYNKQYIKILEKIQEYASKICYGIEQKNFKLTDEFIRVFGRVNLPPSLKAADLNNIDLIFNNIIVGKKWNIIDYEWTFKFPIPINYIIYRAIRIYIEESEKRTELINIGLYKLLGITDDEIIQYNNMEINFEKYVLDNFYPLNKLYGQTTLANIDVPKVLEQQKINYFKNIIQIFYDYGEGFNEKNSFKIYPELNENEDYVVKIDVNPNIKQLRVDPANSESIVIIDKILGYTTEEYSIDYYTNGIKLNNKSILFDNDDPQILLLNIKPETNKIELMFKVQIISKEVVSELNQFIEIKENEIKGKENEIKDKENEIKDKENEIKDKKETIKDKENEMKNKEKIIKDKQNQINDHIKKIEKLELKLKQVNDRIQQYNNLSLIKKVIKQV